MEVRRALVAGGAGFIGSHLCARLLSQGYNRVVCLDNLSTGSLSKVDFLLADPRFVFLRGDVTEKIGEVGDITEIYNLACPASPAHYQKDPLHTLETCVLGSRNLLELAKDRGSRILLASTSEVYGNPLVGRQSEGYFGNVNPYGIRSCYDEGKRASETLFHDFHHVYSVDTRILRIFNTYGPGMSVDDGRVVSNFIVQALLGEPLTVHGDGAQTRSFQYVTDLMDAMTAAMADGIPHSPVNVGNPREITIGRLAEKIIRMTASKSIINYRELPGDDPCRRCPDISLARRILGGWSPKVDLEEGLSKTIGYFKRLLKTEIRPYQVKANVLCHE